MTAAIAMIAVIAMNAAPHACQARLIELGRQAWNAAIIAKTAIIAMAAIIPKTTAIVIWRAPMSSETSSPSKSPGGFGGLRHHL